MKKINRLNKKEEGQSLVEFALILPILLLLIMGIIQFSIIFSAQIAVTNAAREGARTAAVGHTHPQIIERMNSSIGGHIFLPSLTDSNVTITSDGEVGKEITVSITGVKLKLFVPVPDVFVVGNEISLSGKSSMRLEKLAE